MSNVLHHVWYGQSDLRFGAISGVTPVEQIAKLLRPAAAWG